MQDSTKHTFYTMADMFNTVSVDNFDRLTEDVLLALKRYAILKWEIDKLGEINNYLEKDWGLEWIDDGKIECSIIIKKY